MKCTTKIWELLVVLRFLQRSPLCHKLNGNATLQPRFLLISLYTFSQEIHLPLSNLFPINISGDLSSMEILLHNHDMIMNIVKKNRLTELRE